MGREIRNGIEFIAASRKAICIYNRMHIECSTNIPILMIIGKGIFQTNGLDHTGICINVVNQINDILYIVVEDIAFILHVQRRYFDHGCQLDVIKILGGEVFISSIDERRGSIEIRRIDK